MVVRPEAHRLRFLCVHRQRFLVGINFKPVEHGLQLVMDIGQQREVVSKQHGRITLAMRPVPVVKIRLYVQQVARRQRLHY